MLHAPMKAVIQCSATKRRAAGSFTSTGQRVKFVAHPELYRRAASHSLFRPDDTMPSTSTTWRQHLLAYNRRGDNPDGLLQADRLVHEFFLPEHRDARYA